MLFFYMGYMYRDNISERVLYAGKNLNQISEERGKRKRVLFDIFDIHQNTSDTSECLTVKTVPPFVICIHLVKKDVWVSGTLKQGIVWEKEIVKIY